jgi:N-acetyltransferase
LHKCAHIGNGVRDEKIAKGRYAQGSPEARCLLRVLGLRAHSLLLSEPHLRGKDSNNLAARGIMGQMEVETPILQGAHVRLEPLGHHHVEGLAAASSGDPSLYQWSPVPRNKAEATAYVETALAWRDAGSAVPFAIIRLVSSETNVGNVPAVIGSTRFFNIERWPWPAGHARYGREFPDACEIGYTWLASSAIRTAANTEAKLLMLTHAFETWRMLRVCLHADAPSNASAASSKAFSVPTGLRPITSPVTRHVIRLWPRSGRE